MRQANKRDLQCEKHTEIGCIGEPDRAAIDQSKQSQTKDHSQRKEDHLNSVFHRSLAQTDSIALTNPSAQAAGEYSFTRSLLLEPISTRSAESPAKRDIAVPS